MFLQEDLSTLRHHRPNISYGLGIQEKEEINKVTELEANEESQK